MPIDNTLSVTTAAAEIAELILVDLAEGGREADDAASFAMGLQDGLEAAVCVFHGVSVTDTVTPHIARSLRALEAELRFRLGLS